MDFDTSDLEWLTEIVRSHIEALDQLKVLPPHERHTFSAELARRQMVLGSQGFMELVSLMSAHRADLTSYRESAETLTADAIKQLEQRMTMRAADIRQRTASIRLLLGRIS